MSTTQSVTPRKPRKQTRRKKPKSCMFCRRSHTVCGDTRPCTRCIKRGIAHLCVPDIENEPYASTTTSTGFTSPYHPPLLAQQLFPQSFVSENVGSEFSSLNEFLSILEDPLVTLSPENASSEPPIIPGLGIPGNEDTTATTTTTTTNSASAPPIPPASNDFDNNHDSSQSADDKAKEQFFLTAADPSVEISPEERLKMVINAKVEAGLLKPYNYGKGYTRLQEYMDLTMSPEQHKRILHPLSSIRPAFRSIARSLKDIDLVLVEEAFERMLLSYDRVFTSMSMPACLWRRTGEIYRANKEFASIVGHTVDDLRDGNFTIYELMNEESAVNYWEKYGSIAFDKGQKAVLTTCALRNKRSKTIECCFSFTIRRDRYNMPMCIVGNFIPIPK